MCHDIPPLNNDKRVYRTLMRAGDFQGGRPTLQAFERRRSDNDGISVDYDVAIPDGCATALTGKKRAILRLDVGHVRETPPGLDVIPDSLTHANIIGTPSFDDAQRDQEAKALSMKIAARLVEVSEIEWIPPPS